MTLTNRALTITELIIASLLVGIVMLGVLNADYAIRRMDNNSNTDTRLAIQMSALGETIRLDIKRVHGYPGETTAGINVAARTICFRYDTTTPQIYTDDNWSCYTQPAADTRVFRCTYANNPAACGTGDTFVGELVLNGFSHASIPPPQLTANANTGDYYFRMTLVGRATPSAGADVNAAGLTVGTPANPQVVIRLQENIGSY